MAKLLSTQQAAEALGVKDTSTVRQAIHRGSLKGEKIGRDWFITPEEIERYKKNKEENWRKS